MKIAITGTPGTGKTTLAKNLSKELGLDFINEKDLALQNKIGAFNDANELEIPIKEFQRKANTTLKKRKNIILEGHLLCEAKLNVDYLILITINPEKLEQRLESRNYPAEKVMDNVFCEGIEYCKKQAKRNYKEKKIIEINSGENAKLTFEKTLYEIKKRIAQKSKKQ